MTLQFRATLIDNDPKAERPKTTYWSVLAHARDWAKTAAQGSPDPEAFVAITELTERHVENVQREPKK